MLTDRQRRFVELYADGPTPLRFNATRSAEAAGYAWPDKQGPRLTTFPAVVAEVHARFRAHFPGDPIAAAMWPEK